MFMHELLRYFLLLANNMTSLITRVRCSLPRESTWWWDSSEVSDESLLFLLSPFLLSSSLPLTFWGPSLGIATPSACWQSCITKKFIPRVNDTCLLTGFSHTGLEREQLEQTQGRTLKQDAEWKWDSSPGLSYQGNGCLPHEHAF